MKFFRFLLVFIILSCSASRAETLLRLTCEDVRGMGLQALQQAMDINSILFRERELAIQASSNRLNSTDRAYLDAELSQLNSEIDRFINQTSLTDSYGEIYFWFKDGMRFRTLVRPRLGGDSFPLVFEIERINLEMHSVSLLTQASAKIAQTPIRAATDKMRLYLASLGMMLDVCAP